MKLGRKPGIVRRPIEYVLPVLIIGLLIVLVLTIKAINDSVMEVQESNTASGEETDIIEGTFKSISELAEKDMRKEESLDKQGDQAGQDTSGIDAAADNIGGVYDESQY